MHETAGLPNLRMSQWLEMEEIIPSRVLLLSATLKERHNPATHSIGTK
jgi:hypothetical protein